MKTLKKRAVAKRADFRMQAPVMTGVKPLKIKSTNPNVRLYDIGATSLKMSTRNLPQTYAAAETDTKRVTFLMSVMPDGLNIAWATCGTCHSHFLLCKCPNGISVTRSVEYIYDQTVARANGEDWGFAHPNYQGSTTRKWREALASRSTVVGHGARTRTPEPARKSLTRPSGGVVGGRLSKVPTQRTVSMVDVTDIAATNAAAAASSEAMTKALKKTLSKGSVPKTLRKHGNTKTPSTSAKRILKKG